ncbi:hypothetical protein ACLKA6_014925 [Drosophila palustris]
MKSRRKPKQRRECSAQDRGTDHGVGNAGVCATQSLVGLLDTGASVSLLGTGGPELIEQLGLKMTPSTTTVQAAGGTIQKLIGKIQANFKYANKESYLTLYVCPFLLPSLYLGIDFWRKFGLAPSIVGVEALDQVESEFLTKSEPVEPHILDAARQEKLEEIKSQFRSYEREGLGKTYLDQHTIQLVDGSVPVKERFYPVSPAVQKLLFAEVDEMLRLGVIELSESPWSNRMTLVRKPGKNRLCLDARKRNAVSVKDAYPLQNIESILSRVDDTVFISSVDLKHAFWQIELDPKSRKYTAFTIPEHMELVSKVAKCLSSTNLTIGLQKSKFCFKYLRYLGFVISEGSLRTDPEKVKAILKIPVPRSVRQLKSFLGTAGWYRRFIRDFSGLSASVG